MLDELSNVLIDVFTTTLENNEEINKILTEKVVESFKQIKIAPIDLTRCITDAIEAQFDGEYFDEKIKSTLNEEFKNLKFEVIITQKGENK